MLRKLLKHEIKATSRCSLILYLAIFVLTIGNKIFMQVDAKVSDTNKLFMTVETIFAISYFVLIIAAGVVIFIAIIKRFYDNMLKDEGYLMFTLPTTVGKHIASKAITGYIWIVATGIVCVLSFFVLAFHPGVTVLEDIRKIFNNITEAGMWGNVVKGIIAVAIGIYAVILEFYTCLSIGQLYSKHRIGGAVIAYIVIYIISQIVRIIFISVIDIETIYVAAGLNYLIVFGAVKSVIFTLITRYILTNRLNLE